MRKRKATNK